MSTDIALAKAATAAIKSTTDQLVVYGPSSGVGAERRRPHTAEANYAWVDEPHHMGKATTIDKGSTNEAATHPGLISKSIPPGQVLSSPRSKNQQTREIGTIAQISQTKELKKHRGQAQEDTNCHASATSRGAQGKRGPAHDATEQVISTPGLSRGA